MVWPTQNDYDEAAENLRYSMSDDELRAGQAALDGQQLPMVWTGSFASVYRINCPATGKSWALKCFTREVSARQERYRHIAAALEAARLPFTVPFVYLERGIQIHGQWYPAVKMEWVEGQTLNRFVEESLEKPKMLRQLLDLWPKLAARLRDAGIAHADLQHGNVLLVPAADGKLALKLIDYDGMYVPTLAGTRSGEAGHANYQHPMRLLEGTYNAHVDRFSHLVIFSTVHYLVVGKRDFWKRFNNDENLLFREQDFQHPEQSELFRSLWETNYPNVRGLVGRLALACKRPLEEVPWLDELVFNARVRPLSRKEESQVDELLSAGETPVSSVSAAEESAEEGAVVVLEDPVVVLSELPNSVSQPLAFLDRSGNVALPDKPRKRRPGGGGLLSLTRWLDTLFRRLVGEDNDLARYLLWATLPLLLLAAASVATIAFWPTSPSPQIAQKPSVKSAPKLKLPEINPQTVEAGKPLTFAVPVVDAAQWKGKLRFSLPSKTPRGAWIDPESGQFSWTPPLDLAAGTEVIAVAVEGPNGQKDETSFAVNVLRPIPPLKLKPIPAQTVEAGKPLHLAVTLENPDAWQGKVALRH